MENSVQTIALANRRAARARVATPNRTQRRIVFNVVVAIVALLLTAVALATGEIYPSSPIQTLSSFALPQSMSLR
jgi:hypothetical protein